MGGVGLVVDGPAGKGTVVAVNEMRQAARRGAAERATQLRRERAELAKRRESLAATVLVAVGERDALVAAAERRAGVALAQLVDSGLPVGEAVRWCDLDVKEGLRLVRLAETPTATEPTPSPSAATAGGRGGA